MAPAPFLFDGHTDLPTRLWESPADLHRACPDRHVDLPRLRQGGVGGLVCAFFLPQNLTAEEGLAHAKALHAATVAQLDGELRLATSPAELDAVAASGAVAAVFGLENGRPLILAGALERLLAMGVRIVTLTHMGTHEWCDSSTDAPQHDGLSPEGEEIVRALNRHGVLVDVAHVSDRAVEHVLEVSIAPVVASHSSARALCDHPRNLTDELARAIVARGGVVMVNAFPVFLSPLAEAANRERMATLREPLRELEQRHAGDPVALVSARQELLARLPQPPVPLEVYVDHVIHLLGVVGERGVGIGTDFDGIPECPVGFEDASRFPALVAALRARGLDEPTLRLVLGDNFRRVWRDVERLAAA